MYRKAALLALVILSMGLTRTATVQAAGLAQGVSVNPALKNITMQTGQADTEFTTTLENDTDKALTVTPRATDFSARGVNGAIDFSTTTDDQHGLAKYITFSNPRFTIGPKQSYLLHVHITDAAKLGPGGHFTALRYQVAPQQAAHEQVNLQSELVSFLFVASSGQASYKLEAKWSMPHIIWGNVPEDSAILFTNKGDVQAAPHGTLTVTGPLHHQRIAQGVINANSSLVLPGATRLLQTSLISRQPAFWPGRYTADVYYRVRNGEDYTHMQQRFFFIGWLFVVACMVLLALLIGGFIGLRKWRFRKRAADAIDPKPKAVPAKTDKKVKNKREIPVRQL